MNRRPRLRRNARELRARLLLALLALLGVGGCHRDPPVRVIAAEFLDQNADGRAQPDETILLHLDRPLPEELSVEDIEVEENPRTETEWAPEVRRSARGAEVLEVIILTGHPEFRLAGIHGEDEGATGLRVRLGNAAWQHVDLQLRRSVPQLRRAIWEDSSPPGGNGVVDQGDRIRLVFDEPVVLGEGAEGTRVRVPQEILLTRGSLDRLDDGVVPAHYAPGGNAYEVAIVLGSGVYLNVAGELPEVAERFDRASRDTPSGLALNGTDILPMGRIISRRGGPGCASLEEVDLEYPKGFPPAAERRDEALPAPGSRAFHTLTPLTGAYVVMAGGRTRDGEALADVVVYNPLTSGPGANAFNRLSASLPTACFGHTATLLAGPSGVAGSLDSYIVLAGGTNGTRSLGELTIVRIESTGEFSVETLEETLEGPRDGHAAVAVSRNSVLIDGGTTRDADGEAIVGCAELLRFETAADGRVLLAERTVLRSLPRRGHSLTLVGSTLDRWVLMVGGFGRNRFRYPYHDDSPLGGVVSTGDECRCPLEWCSVLAAPLLLGLDRPGRPVIELRSAEYRRGEEDEYDLHYSYLRRGHRAVGLDGDREQAPMPSTEVLIVGGTPVSPHQRFRGWPNDLWEIPMEVQLGRLVTRRPPSAPDALSAVVFTFDPRDPARSERSVIPYPAPDPTKEYPRTHFSATLVPGLGVLVAGGETPALGDGDPLSSIDIFLPREKRFAPYSVPLLSPRTGHRAYLFERESGRHLLLLGGRGGDDSTFRDVEEIPLPPR
ncbi:MAG: kelch repeat-containing protein [Planctomycetota bacterium]|nr:kelch repeat-containing protein [Planctomycetota bacterium]